MVSQNLKIYIYRDYETKRFEMKAEELAKMARGKRWKEYTTDAQLPGGWVEVVATCPDAVEWQDHPQVKAWKKRGRLAGWDRRGNRIWSGGN